jgi:hypothetical protein
MRGNQAVKLLDEVLIRLAPELPTGVHVGLTPHRKWISLQRWTDESTLIGSQYLTPSADGESASMGGLHVPSLSPWVPFLPRRLKAKLTAQQAVEVALQVAFSEALGGRELDFDVRMTTDAVGVHASYRPLDAAKPRVQLAPLSWALF